MFSVVSVILLEFRFLVEYRIRMSRSNLDLIHIVYLLIIERDVYKAHIKRNVVKTNTAIFLCSVKQLWEQYMYGQVQLLILFDHNGCTAMC